MKRNQKLLPSGKYYNLCLPQTFTTEFIFIYYQSTCPNATCHISVMKHFSREQTIHHIHNPNLKAHPSDIVLQCRNNSAWFNCIAPKQPLPLEESFACSLPLRSLT